MSVTDELRAEMTDVRANLAARPWIQGRMQAGQAVCAHGAVMTCQGLRPGDAPIIRAVMRARGVTEDWNDGDGRTKAEVEEALAAIAVTDADLAATFGPQWRRVVALVRRAAIVTEPEAFRMAAAQAAAQAAARAAALVAALDAARAAARAPALVAARAAARVAAWDAARAIAVVDLVGQHGFTQAHHDALMAPWIAGVGEDWEQLDITTRERVQ